MQWWIVAVLIAVAGGGAWWWWQQRSGGGAISPGSGRNDRYAPQAVLSAQQTKLYLYLQASFPGQVVMFSQPLSQLVSVRKADDRVRAEQRLRGQYVDFVVFNPDGKPAFAFQVDAFHNDKPDAAKRSASLKHRVLGSAGVRLLRMKNVARSMPEPEEFHQRLQAATLAGQDVIDMEASVPQSWRVQRQGEALAVREIGPDSMSMTDLMGLPTPAPQTKL